MVQAGLGQSDERVCNKRETSLRRLPVESHTQHLLGVLQFTPGREDLFLVYCTLQVLWSDAPWAFNPCFHVELLYCMTGFGYVALIRMLCGFSLRQVLFTFVSATSGVPKSLLANIGCFWQKLTADE